MKFLIVVLFFALWLLPKMLKLLKLPMLKDRNSITVDTAVDMEDTVEDTEDTVEDTEDTAVDTEDVVTVAPSLMRLLKLKKLLLKLPMLKHRSNITEDTAVDTEDTEVDFMVSFPGTSKLINLNLKNGFCYLSTLCYPIYH